MTVIGVSAIQSTTLELKMATNEQNRQTAFQAAEAALLQVERNIQANGIDPNSYRDCSLSSSQCFESTCDGGLCFNGSFTLQDSEIDCSTNNDDEMVWMDDTLDVFGDASKHQTISIDGMTNSVKYIIEFVCFSERGDSSTFDTRNVNNGEPAFRITVLATANDNKSRAAVQSTYRYVN